MKSLLLLFLLMLTSACAQQGRYSQRHDSAPKNAPATIEHAEVIPQYEPYAPANQRPYQVLGVRYQPMETGKGFSAKGTASWYGQKFHGHLTSNGEIYDMYAMTAAHKTLPLPSFARVTNLQNGKQVVVRINDRGPFHRNRLIDLSYAAASKLGVLSTGTAEVKLDVIHLDEIGNTTIGNSPTIAANPSTIDELETPSQTLANARYIQVAALRNFQRIYELAESLSALYEAPHSMPNENGLYRLHLGPIEDERVQEVLLELRNNGYAGAYLINPAPN